MAQSVKSQTLNFGSGHDLIVGEIKPSIELCAEGMEPAWDSISLSLSLSLPHSRAGEPVRSLPLSFKLSK